MSPYSISEAETRYSIITPQLEKRGWNPADRTQVGFEIPVEGYDSGGPGCLDRTLRAGFVVDSLKYIKLTRPSVCQAIVLKRSMCSSLNMVTLPPSYGSCISPRLYFRRDRTSVSTLQRWRPIIFTMNVVEKWFVLEDIGNGIKLKREMEV